MVPMSEFGEFVHHFVNNALPFGKWNVTLELISLDHTLWH